MGCCFSRSVLAIDPANSNNIAAPNHASSSAQALTPGQPFSIASGARPNVPLKHLNAFYPSILPNTLPISSTPASNSHHHTQYTTLSDPTPIWTKSRLERERNDWWDTRTELQPEIWSALRIVVQHLQMGEVPQAQALLDAAECTCPSGKIWKNVYDVHGEEYEIPKWIVVEPSGLVDENDTVGSATRRASGLQLGSGTMEASRKGKEVLDTSIPPFEVRCRLSSTQKDVCVSIYKGEHVSSLVKKLRHSTGIEEPTRLLVVFNGKIYNEHRPLESNPQWTKEYILNIMVLEAPL